MILLFETLKRVPYLAVPKLLSKVIKMFLVYNANRNIIMIRITIKIRIRDKNNDNKNNNKMY